MTVPTFTLHRGTTALLISFPHVGTEIPAALHHRYTPRALAVEDTDWYLDRLYGFAAGLGAGLLLPRYSRYLIDLNRPSDNRPMYSGQNNTELCPTRHFSGDAIYRPGCAPDEPEIQQRVRDAWQPYHDALGAELARLKSVHGHAVLFDAHSIKSELPWLFEGRLPHMNLGTAAGASCAPALERRLTDVFAAQPDYSFVVNGRFKGGQITRSYGRPAESLHAVQLEMCWRAYMDEAPPHRWHADNAAAVTPLLQALVHTMIDWRPEVGA
jgi:N-formylglutamate deformylase